MKPHRLNLKPHVPLVGLAAGLVAVGAAIAAGQPLTLAAGVLMVAINLLLLLRPLIVVTDDDVRHCNVFGTIHWRASYRLEDVTFDGLQMVVHGQRVREMDPRGLSPRQLRRLRAAIEARQAAAARLPARAARAA